MDASYIITSVVLVGIVFVIILVYHATIGYYLDYGWKELMKLIMNKEDIEVDIGLENKPDAIQATIKPFEEDIKNKQNDILSDKKIIQDIMKQESPPMPPPPPPQPSPPPPPPYTPPMQQPNANTAGTVFNVSKNIYTYYDAPAVCKAFNARLATKEQVLKAYEQGADWCNYGWTEGQMALYPTQTITYQKLQRSKPELANSCGKPGVNGGFFDNPELRFGVNCFGQRPAKTPLETLESQTEIPPSSEEIEFEKKVHKYRENLQNIAITPFKRAQ